MRRDMDVIRAMVLALRDTDKHLNSVEGIDKESFLFHAQLLVESGLVVGSVATDNRSAAIAAVLFRLTWSGHDFADSIGDKSVWDKAKARILGPSVSWSFDILREVVGSVIKEEIDL